MNPELTEAYRQTTYVATTPRGELHIRIGESHPDLDELLAAHNADEWAYITAWNPRSELLTDQQNRQRQRQLEAELRDAGYTLFPGRGVPDTSDWAPEDSLLVVGIPRQNATHIATRYAQNAIVYGRAGNPAELVWCAADDESAP